MARRRATGAAKVTAKGQITIPKAVREALDVEPSDYLLFEQRGKDVAIRKATLASADEFDALAARVAQRFKRLGVSPADVEHAVGWARRP